MQYRLKIGYASKGDIKTFERLLDSLDAEYAEEDGFIYTGWVSSSAKSTLEAEANRLIVPCVVIDEKKEEDDEVKRLKDGIRDAIALLESLL